MEESRTYNSRLQKGGALIPEMRALIRLWDPSEKTESLVENLVQENVLGKISRARMKDVINRTFLPRYVYGNPPDSWKYLQPLELAGWPAESMKLLLYYHAAKSEQLMYDFVVEDIYERYQKGRLHIGAQDARAFFAAAARNGKVAKAWTDSVAARVARGLMAALRDFGIFDGKAAKTICKPSLPIPCFAYIAFLVKRSTPSGERLLLHPDWRLFLLTTEETERLFIEAHQQEYLEYHALGNIIRLDFKEQSMKEYVNGILERTS